MRLIILGALMLPLLASAALAQTDQRLDRLERRLDELEAKLRSRDEEIAQLKGQLNRAAPTSAAAAPTEQAEHDHSEHNHDDAEHHQQSPVTFPAPLDSRLRLAVVGDVHGNVSTLNANPARNRIDVAALELHLRAAIDPRAEVVAILPFFREVEDPLFVDAADANSEIETGVEIEEAYLFLHDFGVAGLTARLGRFRLHFGRQNLLHRHEWHTVDGIFVNQSFLGPEALADTGLSLGYQLPRELVGGEHVEAIVELVTGEGDDEQPVVNNDASVDSPALNTHLLWRRDLSRDWSIELGGSWLIAQHNNDNQQDANLFGADLTFVRRDHDGGFSNQLIQLEAIHGDVETSRADRQHATGASLLLQQQLDRRWFTGLRLDWTENALDDTQEVWAVSPYLTWKFDETLRFRVEYQHRDGDVPSEETLYFQATWMLGDHPPHAH